MFENFDTSKTFTLGSFIESVGDEVNESLLADAMTQLTETSSEKEMKNTY